MFNRLKISSVFLCIAVVLVTSPAKTAVRSMWVGPEGSKPLSYLEYTKVTGDPEPFDIEKIYNGMKASNPSRLVDVIVNAALFPQITSSLNQYISDLEADGYTVALHATSGGSPSDLRTFLHDQLPDGLAGAVLIGDMPVAWYEMDVWGHEEFPIDLYYMDLDGEWLDADVDGVFDGHTGATDPEIWVGRLTASPLTFGGSNEVSLVENYFDKNHRYRTGELSFNNRALLYVDDDFRGDTDEWENDVNRLYSDLTVVSDPLTTRATDYGARLVENYHWVQVHVHSWPGGHAFQLAGSSEYLYGTDLISIDPVACFYNLYACSNARYVETDYMGGWYIFTDSYGLGAIGSTKTGGMYHFGEFYGTLDRNRSLGEAYKTWCTMWSEACPEWFYGLTLLGDPTLRACSGFAYRSHSVDDDAIGQSAGNDDGTVDAGETVELGLVLGNCGHSDAQNVTATLTTADAYITISDGTRTFGHISEGDTAASMGSFVFHVSPDCPDGHSAKFSLQIEDGALNSWRDDFRIGVEAPLLLYASLDVDDSEGDGDGYADPGERVRVTLHLVNEGAQDAGNVSVALSTSDEFLQIEYDSAEYGEILSGGSAASRTPYVFTIDQSCPLPHFTVFELAITAEGGHHSCDTFTQPLSGGTGFVDNVENGRNGWTHAAVTPNFKDEWHRSTGRNHTPGGTTSWKCGDPGNGPYASGADGGLVTPPFEVTWGCQLSLWQWRDIEEGYDGGIVEIDDGAGWIQIFPLEGYNSIVGNPFPPNTPCFSGTADWERVVFDLSAYSGEVRVRFRFGSDGGLTQEGWYIDDLTVEVGDFVVLDDFESGTEGWDTGTGWGVTGFGNNNTTAINDSPQGNYPNNANNCLTYLRPFDVSSASVAAVTYWHWYFLEEGHDWGYVEASSDGNTWTQLAGYSGFLNFPMQRGCVLLNDFCGTGGDSVRVRFRVVSDEAVAYSGWYLDDIYFWKNTLPAEKGDVTCDGSVNILDVVRVVTVILGTGSNPTNFEEWAGDCNGDGQVDVLDALGVVNVILGHGECVPEMCRDSLTPETMDFLKSLDTYLFPEQYARLMELVKAASLRPDHYTLEQNYPNPFNPTTSIRYSVAGDQSLSDVTLVVYNMLGQEVRTLVDEEKKAGYYTVTWDGKNEKGEEISSGVYFYRIQAGKFARTMPMVLLK